MVHITREGICVVSEYSGKFYIFLNGLSLLLIAWFYRVSNTNMTEPVN